MSTQREQNRGIRGTTVKQQSKRKIAVGRRAACVGFDLEDELDEQPCALASNRETV